MTKVIKAYGMNKCIGCLTCMIVCAGVNEKSHSLNKSRLRIKTAGGLQGRFVCNVCQSCREEAPCAEVCPVQALTMKDGGGVTLNADKCIGCGKCSDACTVQAIFFDELTMKPLICKQCGACTRFCPHDCLKMEEVSYD